MSQYPVACILIQPDTSSHSRQLEAALRRSAVPLSLRQLQRVSELRLKLTETPALVFWHGPLSQGQEQYLVDLIQRYSPDTILVKVSASTWEPLEPRLLTVEVCGIAATSPNLLDQQLHFLLKYAQLKQRFRHSKHLLRVAELRSQWLVDHSREAVAYLVQGLHVHANVTYLALFGLNYEAEVLNKSILNFIKDDERSVCQPLLTGAEQTVQPSNKILLTLYRSNKHSFRAYVRFIPAVFQGQRCVQVHVHPLELKVSVPAQSLKRYDPWQNLAATSTDALSTAAINPAGAVSTPIQTSLQLRVRFREALTVRSGLPTLLFSEAYLQTSSGRVVEYAALKQQSDQNHNRFRLDGWLLRNAMSRTVVPGRGQLALWVWLEIGEWLLVETEARNACLQALQKNKRMASQLVFALPLNLLSKQESVAKSVLELMRAAGVQLALQADSAQAADAFNQAQLLKLDVVRLFSPAEQVREWARTNAVETPLQQAIAQFAQAGIKVVIDGLADITSLNWLCTSPVSYLSGGILEKFRHEG